MWLSWLQGCAHVSWSCLVRKIVIRLLPRIVLVYVKCRQVWTKRHANIWTCVRTQKTKRDRRTKAHFWASRCLSRDQPLFLVTSFHNTFRLSWSLHTGLDILYNPKILIQRVSGSVTPSDFSELQFQSFRRFTITGERHILFRRFLILHEVL